MYVIHTFFYVKKVLPLSNAFENYLSSYVVDHSMAGVLERIRGPGKRLVEGSLSISRADKNALQLQAAMEILAEVFGIGIQDVEEMLKQRYEENVEWPQEFSLTE